MATEGVAVTATVVSGYVRLRVVAVTIDDAGEYVLIRDARYKLYREGKVVDVMKECILMTHGVSKCVSLCSSGKREIVSLKTLIYSEYVFPPGPFKIGHKDGNTENCHVDNLFLLAKLSMHVIMRNSSQYPRPGHANARPPFSRYLVSWTGEVYNLQRNRRLVGVTTSDNYQAFSPMTDCGARKNILVHRFVYWCFFPEFDIDDTKTVIDHRDGNRQNNSITNLSVTCSKGNAGNRKSRPSDGNYGRAVEVTEGYRVTKFEMGLLACNHYGINRANFSRAIRTGAALNGLRFRYYFEDMVNETWVKIIKYDLPEWAPEGVKRLEGLYVSSKGRLMGKSGIVSRARSGTGMMNSNVFLSELKACVRVHQVVCYAFHGPPAQGESVDHRNRDHQDNRAHNLRWADSEVQSYNTKTARPVVKTCLTTGEETTFSTLVSAAENAGVRSGLTISDYCKSGKVLANATWRFTEPEAVGIDDTVPIHGDPRTTVPVSYELVRMICQRGGAKQFEELA